MSIQTFLIQTSTTRSIYIHIYIYICVCRRWVPLCRTLQNWTKYRACVSLQQLDIARENESSIQWKSSNTNKFVSSDREKEFSQINKEERKRANRLCTIKIQLIGAIASFSSSFSLHLSQFTIDSFIEYISFVTAF